MPDELDPIPMFPTVPAAQTSDAAMAMERLNEQNRILLEARMLPRGKKLTDEQIDAVREAFAKYTAEREITPAQVAREINYGATVVSQWQSRTYKGSYQNVTHAINDWMERDHRRADAQRPKDYVSTWVAETMRTVAYQADKLGMMAAIVAPAGSGKTLILKALVDQMRGVYVYCHENITVRELLLKIATAMGFRLDAGSRSASKIRLIQWISENLKGTKRPIFLDEAQNLHRAISSVRSIYDQAEVPIIMAGTSQIHDYINDRTDGKGQFSSRCLRFNVVEHVRSVEGPGGGGKAGRDLFSVDEVKAFYASKKIRLANDALMMLWALACQVNHGTMRLIEKLADNALAMNPEASVLQAEHVIEAMELFFGPVHAKYLGTLVERYEQIAKVG